MTPFLANILLALAWMALTGTYTAGGFFTGALVGFFVLWITRRGRGTTGYLTKVRAVAGFIAFFFRELVLANLRVAHDVLTPRHYMTPGILAVPLDVESDLEITVLATVISLTPGSLSLHLADDRRTLYVHAMYVDNPEALVREIKEGFERRVREVFR
ncbi:Na+/H+ antiporter subunit E [Geobacter sulfurreducens]|uniref:Na+/H+ antiporter subunit E n=1 Tax=Geobacter sulfurreducens TaxID=35554 RepID=UPI0001D8F050|nr:Na+/H+ antiporter subunit E [Geobacter sulfurreducens]ADI85098.1 sodium/proton antiporter complex Mrp, protein E [Geobacter sulfurreducens KN400]AJY68562.1 cation:proton antiporter [Geobacter sulfurreducens]QVW34183.1 Na+/H+ antiporter subunit E [Geobacter sulfurreducens]UTG91695.1 Na+/H+ antiporter subunit E [Geobacter sulfurreducens]